MLTLCHLAKCYFHTGCCLFNKRNEYDDEYDVNVEK